MVRFTALIHSQNNVEAIPILNNLYNYKSLPVSQVLTYIIDKMPKPDESVPWEQIFDFINDGYTKAAYYRLINWVNVTSAKNPKLNEVDDEFNFLYHSYKEQYRIHKMKYKLSSIEILTTCGLDMFVGGLGLGTIRSNLFSIWRREIGLLEAETKFANRELAYIFKAINSFNVTKLS
jgi:hypothetical protein